MAIPGGWELGLIVLVFMLMFGMNRLPEAARNLGKSLRILRTEVADVMDDEPNSRSRNAPSTE